MAGRTPLRIGQRGKINRTYIGGGVWEAKCRYRDIDGVTRRVTRRSPAGERDRHGKLAEDALIESLANRRPPSDEVGPDTPIMALVDAHLHRLAEDGRSPATQDTYKLVAGKLRAKLGGVRVTEATPARIDAVLRTMTNAHGPGIARQAKTILSGALQLAVMANVLAGNPVRDVAAIKARRPPRGAPALSVEQLRELLKGLRGSDYCREYDLADPFTLLIATGLRRGELLGLRWSDYDQAAAPDNLRQGRPCDRPGPDARRRDQDRRGPTHHRFASIRSRRSGCAAGAALFRGASDDHVSVNGGDLARSEQFWSGLAAGPPRSLGFPRSQRTASGRVSPHF